MVISLAIVRHLLNVKVIMTDDILQTICKVVTVLGIYLSFCLFSAESCVDGIQNQGENGIDCGGPCPTCGK